ncbi:hypothetical protein AC788_03180 [Pseudomonas sp. RIT-PI-a]|nr:hypothetical protein AC788_03180 [Pseudomonas sp. RIT-PI-a]
MIQNQRLEIFIKLHFGEPLGRQPAASEQLGPGRTQCLILRLELEPIIVVEIGSDLAATVRTYGSACGVFAEQFGPLRHGSEGRSAIRVKRRPWPGIDRKPPLIQAAQYPDISLVAFWLLMRAGCGLYTTKPALVLHHRT